MPTAESIAGTDRWQDEILKPAEVAAYLRVSEDVVLKMAAEKRIPAQNLGGEWRFSRKALADWMRYGDELFRRGWPFHPGILLESPFIDELLVVLEHHLVRRLKDDASAKPGSKQAVLKHFGVFKSDDDLEERLADARKRREARE